LLCIAVAGVIFSAQPSQARRTTPDQHIGHQLLIKYRSPAAISEVHVVSDADGTSATRAAAQRHLAGRLGIRYERQLSGSDWRVVEFADEMTMDDALALAQANPAVENAEPNYVLHLFSAAATIKKMPAQVSTSPPNDPGFGYQWALQNTGQFGGTVGADIGTLSAWQIAHSHQTVVVAIIDTGADYRHPDLVNRIWANSHEVTGNDMDDDGNGYVDDVRGWNFSARNNDPMDDHYHGTHMAGTIAAEINNGIGLAGIAGPLDVRIMPLKFFDANAQGTVSAAIEALDYATRNGARIINISWGDTTYSQALYDAVRRSVSAGCLVVAAAGNTTPPSDNDRTPIYPANFNSGPNALPGVISVAGTDQSDQMLYDSKSNSGSNYGATSVDLAAPSNFIYSTMPPARGFGDYAYLSGTSSAAAFVSGVAALVWAQNPTLTNTQVKQIIVNSVRRVSATQGKTISGGIAHAYQALLATPPVDNPVVPVSAADYNGIAAAPDSIIAAFGVKLATGTEVAQSLPLPTNLAGSTVRINGVAAPLFAVTPGQINFLVPPGLPNGIAEITVVASDGSRSSGTINIAAFQPSIFTTNQAGFGPPAAVWTPDGLRYFSVGNPDGAPVPMDAGGYLVLACTGLRHAPNTDGNGGNGVAENVQVTIGGVSAPVFYAGAQGFYAGLDQVNVQVPMSLGKGQVELVMTVAGKLANKVVLAIR
jgi:uncharacterized protein (TIGR03437 family)